MLLCEYEQRHCQIAILARFPKTIKELGCFLQPL